MSRFQLDRTETTRDILGQENVFVATTTLGAGSNAAYEAAEHLLEESAEKPSPAGI